MNLPLELDHERRRFLSRRWFFRECGVGLGSIALASLLGDLHELPTLLA
jgi:hypothetical protein